jgi:WD40 repeat protein
MNRRGVLKGFAASAAAWPLSACDHSVRTFGSAPTYSVAFAPDGRTCLSGGSGSLKLWDVGPSEWPPYVLRDFPAASSVDSVAFSPDGRTALSGGDSRTVRLWDIATGQWLRNFWDANIVFRSGERNSELKPDRRYAHLASVTSVAFSPDGRTALSGSRKTDGEDGVLKLWDVATGEIIRTFPFTSPSQYVGSVAFSPDGLTALSGGNDGNFATFKLWEVATGKELRTFSGGNKSVAFSPDGLTALSNHLDLWEVATGNKLRSFTEESHVNSVTFSPDGRTALSGGWRPSAYPGHELLQFLFPSHFNRDGTVRLWEVATGKQLRSLKGHSGQVHSVAFAPDGRSALSGGNDGIRLWDLTRS